MAKVTSRRRPSQPGVQAGADSVAAKGVAASSPSSPPALAATTTSSSTVQAGDFLFGPGECDEPIPTPPLVRRYRYNVLIGLPPVDGVPVAPPLTVGSLIAKAMTPGATEAAGTLADFVDGVPINAEALLETKGAWHRPLLPEVVVADIGALARTGTAAASGKRWSIDPTAPVLATLAAGGEVIVPVLNGASVQRIRLRAGEAALREAPAVHVVDDATIAMARATVCLPGLARPVALTARQKGDLLQGRPVVSGRGRDAVILCKAALARSSQSAMVAGSIETGLGTVVVASPPPVAPSVPPAGSSAPPPLPPPARSGAGPDVASSPPAVVEMALLVPFEQRWTLKTYERGELISAIGLTPLEEVTIEVFSWDRRKSSVEDSSSSEAERTAEAQSIDRDTRDVFSELTRNSSFTWGLKGELSAGGYGSIGGNVGGGNTLNDVARRTGQTLQEATEKSTEKVKSSRQTKITEAIEEGSETRTTRKLRNANQAYPVTYNYFEVLARYSVVTDCLADEIVPVLTVPGAGGRLVVDVDFVRGNEAQLRRGLLTAALAAGFDAARLLWMRERACEELCRECLCSSDAPNANSALFMPAAAAAMALSRAVVQMPATPTSVDWRGFFHTIAPLPMGSAVPLGVTYDQMRRSLCVAALEWLQPGLWGGLHSAARALLAGSAPAPAQVMALYAAIVSVDPAVFDRATAPDAQVKGELQSHVGRLVNAAYATGARASLAAMIQNHVRGINATLDAIVDSLARLPVSSDAQARNLIVMVILYVVDQRVGFATTVDGGVKPLVQPAKDAIKPWLDERSGQDQAARTAAAAARTAREGAITAMFPTSKVLAARERFDALKRHIEDNNDYYAFLLLTEQIARGRYVAPPAIGLFLPLITPRPVAVIDGRLCFAFNADAPGARAVFDRIGKLTQGLVNDGKALEVTLPTPGFVIEPKLSMCSAAESYVEEARRIELEQRQALAIQAEMEAKRRRALIEGPTPVLDPFDPTPAALRIALEQPQP